MKIALMITGMGMGGAERQVSDLADRFAALDHQVLILYLTGEAIIQPKSSDIELIGMGMSKTPLSFIQTYIRLRRILKDYAPDILHTHMVHANLMGRMLRPTLSIPRLICTAHNTNEGGALRMLLYRLTDPLCDLTTNVSHEATEAFIAKKAVSVKKIITVYNGIDTDQFCFNADARMALRHEYRIEDHDTLLLCVGRLEEQKDYPTMLHAFALSEAQHPNLFLWIAGDGEEKEKLLHLCNELKITGKVRFLGIRHDIPELMSACDLFCLSSIFEGFGLVVAEAMACERPVVATDCGGVKEIVAEDGYLVPVASPELFSEAILHALQSPKHPNRERIIKMFSLETIANRWIGLYTSQNPYESAL